jgi:membrane-associated phospholipid phosphatase
MELIAKMVMYRVAKNTWKKFWASLALLSVDVAIILVLFFASLVAFVWIAKYIFLDDKTAFDDAAFATLSSWVSNVNTGVMEAFTFLGQVQFLAPAHLLLTAWFLFVRKHRWYTIKVPVIGLSSGLLMLGLKDLFDRPRPLTPLLEPVAGLSFPSGHALCSMTFFGLLIYFAWKHVRNVYWRVAVTFLLGCTICMIGLSRVYLRVHHASDVIAGFALGIIWLVISLKMLKAIENYSRKKVAPKVGYGDAPTVQAKVEAGTAG